MNVSEIELRVSDLQSRKFETLSSPLVRITGQDPEYLRRRTTRDLIRVNLINDNSPLAWSEAISFTASTISTTIC